MTVTVKYNFAVTYDPVRRLTVGPPEEGLRKWLSDVMSITVDELAGIVNEVGEQVYIERKSAADGPGDKQKYGLDHVPEFMRMHITERGMDKRVRRMQSMFEAGPESRAGKAKGIQWRRQPVTVGGIMSRGRTRVFGIVTLEVLHNKYGDIYNMQDKGTSASKGRYVPEEGKDMHGSHKRGLGKRLVGGPSSASRPSPRLKGRKDPQGRYGSEVTLVWESVNETFEYDIGWHSQKGYGRASRTKIVEDLATTGMHSRASGAYGTRRGESPTFEDRFVTRTEDLGDRPKYGIVPRHLTSMIKEGVEEFNLQVFLKRMHAIMTHIGYMNGVIDHVTGKEFRNAFIEAFRRVGV